MRRLTFLLLAFLFVGSLRAQQGLSIGVNATPMSTWILNGDDFDAGAELNFRSTIGWSAGLNLGYNFTDRVGLVSGVLLSNEGQNYITDYDNRTEAEQDVFARELTYIRVPLLFKYNSDISDRTSFLLRVGPYLGFLSSSQVTYDSNLPDAAEETYETQNLAYSLPTSPLTAREGSIFRGFDLALALELGSQVNLSESMQLFFLIRFAGSISSIENSDIIADLRTADNTPLIGGDFPQIQAFPADNNVERRTANNANIGLTVGFNYILAP